MLFILKVVKNDLERILLLLLPRFLYTLLIWYKISYTGFFNVEPKSLMHSVLITLIFFFNANNYEYRDMTAKVVSAAIYSGFQLVFHRAKTYVSFKYCLVFRK